MIFSAYAVDIKTKQKKGCFYEKNKQSHKHNTVGTYAYANSNMYGGRGDKRKY